MTKDEAVALLGLDAGYSDEDVVRRFSELHNDYRIRLTNAPTPALAKTYQKNLHEVLTASMLLAPEAIALVTMPANEPVRKQANTTQTAKADGGVQPKRGDEGLPRSTMVALGVAALLAGLATFFAIVWVQQRQAIPSTNESPRMTAGTPLSATDEARKAAEAERVKIEVERMRLELEKARREDSRTVEEIERAKAEAARRDEEARLSASRGAIQARIEDAKRARAEQQAEWESRLVNDKGERYPGITVGVGAAFEGALPVLSFVMSNEDLERGAYFGTTVALVNYKGEAAFRFPVLHFHARECRGYLYISATRVAYDPVLTPNFKNDAFEVPRDSLRRLGAKSNLFKIEAPQRSYDFAFSARESGGKTTEWWGSPVRTWAESALLNFHAARPEFERAIADIVPAR